MRLHALRWLIPITAAGAMALACGGSKGPSEPDPLAYLDDATYRRSELEASLVNPSNGYSALRLSHYATGATGDWERLPEWNPPVEPIDATELDAAAGASPTALSARAQPLHLPGRPTSVNDPALVALGAAAFRAYPVQLAPYLSVALASRDASARYGLWVDATRGVGGLVRARMADGSGAIAVTCSTCHSAPADAKIEDGLPSAELDLGAAMIDASGIDPANAPAIAAWGSGRLDVTTQAGTEPARIPDLRPTRWLTYLQQDATVRARDLAMIAIRLETLIITSQNEVVRPPRLVALALAAYIESLADGLPASDPSDLSRPGASIFASKCASCHTLPGLSGTPVALDAIGTDPTLGRSAERGTGAYRVPSLHGVGTRGPLLHDGTVASLDVMFDPARVGSDFSGKLHGTGAIPGHRFGLDLAAADRAALLEFLQAL
jgi:hypothetical protein